MTLFSSFFFEKFFHKHTQENLGWHRESWEECVHKTFFFLNCIYFLEGILIFATWRRCGSIFPIVKQAQSGRHYPQLTFEWLLLSAVSPFCLRHDICEVDKSFGGKWSHWLGVDLGNCWKGHSREELPNVKQPSLKFKPLWDLTVSFLDCKKKKKNNLCVDFLLVWS